MRGLKNDQTYIRICELSLIDYVALSRFMACGLSYLKVKSQTCRIFNLRNNFRLQKVSAQRPTSLMAEQQAKINCR